MSSVNFNPPVQGQITDDPRYNERNGLGLGLGAPMRLIPSNNTSNPFFFDQFGTFFMSNAFFPSSFGAFQSGGAIWAGSGVPANANGANGDLYVRTDAPGTATQRLYMKSAGAWVATAA